MNQGAQVRPWIMPITRFLDLRMFHTESGRLCYICLRNPVVGGGWLAGGGWPVALSAGSHEASDGSQQRGRAPPATLRVARLPAF